LVSLKYGELIYNQGRCEIIGRKSDYSLYKKELATYGEGDKFDQKAAEGFVKILGMGY